MVFFPEKDQDQEVVTLQPEQLGLHSCQGCQTQEAHSAWMKKKNFNNSIKVLETLPVEILSQSIEL